MDRGRGSALQVWSMEGDPHGGIRPINGCAAVDLSLLDITTVKHERCQESESR